MVVAPTVLVVDDTASIRFLIRTNLELAGFNVIEADDGRACVELLATLEQLPDLITLDMMMPRMDGLTAATEIRQNPAYDSIGLVMVTTQGLQADSDKAAAIGVDAYVIKPFEPEVLISTVEQVLNDRS